MGQAFDDARLLRSRDTTLTQEEVRLLYGNLETGSNNIQDLRKLNSIGDKIEAALGDYYTKIDAAVLQGKAAVRAGADPQQAEKALAMVLNQLDSTQGQEPCADIMLSLNEWQWAMDKWKANTNFVGLKEIRTKLLRVNDALTNALGVKFEDGQAVIEGG